MAELRRKVIKEQQFLTGGWGSLFEHPRRPAARPKGREGGERQNWKGSEEVDLLAFSPHYF